MRNNINISTLIIGLCLLSLVSNAQSNDNGKMEMAKIDTVFVIQKTDSLAALILQTYDENSMRQTGVPLAIEHYDKAISYNADTYNVLVAYSFNKTKFYGPTGAEIIVKGIDKYPFRFDIIYNAKKNTTHQGKLVENK